ncbi:hypothetical protein J1N35_018412 [Gossypium stocksii]|uniref:RNase H type-1 domain-containing protein n=1 Tax=Gossypium stocksii TaxID=47602 RepID=A0A9D3VQH0_9ROSI|nr:hypothetical protein J1N35_018412 [Gossypium stocksii]
MKRLCAIPLMNRRFKVYYVSRCCLMDQLISYDGCLDKSGEYTVRSGYRLLLRGVSVETEHEARVQWCPPESQWVKVNFDGGFYSDLKASSAGTVIRNEAGLIMGTSCTWNRNIPLAEAAEALAAIQAI